MCHGRLCRHPRLCSNRGMGSAMRVALPLPPTPTYAVRWGESTAPPSQTFNPMLLPPTERAVDHALDRMGIPRRRRRSSQRLRMVEEAGWHPWIADASAADVALLPIGKEGQIGERRPALVVWGIEEDHAIRTPEDDHADVLAAVPSFCERVVHRPLSSLPSPSPSPSPSQRWAARSNTVRPPDECPPTTILIRSSRLDGQ